jgi:hypothetical protein
MSPLRGGALIAITLGIVGICAEIVRVTVKEMAGPLAEQ